MLTLARRLLPDRTNNQEQSSNLKDRSGLRHKLRADVGFGAVSKDMRGEAADGPLMPLLTERPWLLVPIWLLGVALFVTPQL